MAGVLLMFGDPGTASPSSSPMPADARDLPPGLDPFDAQLFSGANGPPGNTQPGCSGSGGCSTYYKCPTAGLGLIVPDAPVEPVCVDPSVLMLAPAAAAPATPRDAPPDVPTRTSLQKQGARALNQVALTSSFVAFACSLGNSLPEPSQSDDTGSRAARHADTAVAAGDAPAAEEQDLGGDTEVEDDPRPSLPATAPSVLLPPQADVGPGVQSKRGKKRAASGGSKRVGKRRRASSSKAQDAAVEPESDADAEDDDRPATSSSGRPTRKAAQRVRRASEQDTPPGSDAETEKPSTCTECRKTFKRIYDLDRHLKKTACGSADKLVCPVCKSALTPRADARRRHLMKTAKCVTQQGELSPALREALGCPTPEERAEYLQAEAARKKAKKSK